MAEGPANLLVDYLNRVVRHGDAGVTDGQLLEAFLERRDESAFRQLLQRHGRMVLGVCRRVLRDLHDTEDAFQATFLVLVRKAAGLRQRQTVGDWLYGVAYHTALKARLAAKRRLARDRKAAEMAAPRNETDSASWSDGLLDQELQRLPAKYRLPLLLCDLEEKSYREAARELGVPEGTLSSRHSRARALLGRRLARHGVALSGAALALSLGQNLSHAAVPPMLVQSTLKAASAVATGPVLASGAVSASVASLTQGVEKAMFLSKLKFVVVILVVAGILGGTASVLVQQAVADKPAGKTATGKPDASPGKVKPGKKDPGNGLEFSGTVQSIDADRALTLGDKRGQETFAISRDVKVFFDDGSGPRADFPAGKLTDLKIGSSATVLLTEDKKTIVTIWAEGPKVAGTVTSVDAAKKTITLTISGKKGGDLESTYALHPNVKIIFHDGKAIAKKKGEPAKPKILHMLAEVPAEALASLRLSADRKVAGSILVEGPEVVGTVQAIDAAKPSISLFEWSDGGLGKKTFALTADTVIWIQSGKGKKEQPMAQKLADVPVGAIVILKLSPDQSTVVGLSASGQALSGVVKSVDAGRGTLTLTIFVKKGSPEEEKVVNVDRDMKITIDRQEGKLSDLPVGAVIKLQLTPDQKRVSSIAAAGRTVAGTVKSVDAASITIGDKQGDNTYTVADKATISIDGKEAKLNEVPIESSASIRLSADGKSALGISVDGPRIKGVLKAVDVQNNRITVEVPAGKNQTEEKMFDLTGKVQIHTAAYGLPVKLADLKADKSVLLALSADKKTVLRITITGE